MGTDAAVVALMRVIALDARQPRLLRLHGLHEAWVVEHQTLGWLGGPWILTYRQLGVPATEQFNNLDAIAIETDATHEHHIHISLGTDQP